MGASQAKRTLSEMPFDEIKVGAYMGEGTYEVTKEEIARFAKLLGYDDPVYSDEEYAKKTEFGGIIAPPGMIFIYGLKLGWELKLFAPGSIRMGDDNEYFLPARPGDVLKTTMSISDKFIKKERKFLKTKLETVNQRMEKVCTVDFMGIIP